MAATQVIQMRVNLRANANEKSDQYGRLYPVISRTGTLDLRGLCKHMSEHNTVYGRDIVTGVLTLMQGCLVELLSQGVAVKLDGIGTFYPTLKSAKNGAADIEEAKRLGAANLVQGVHVRFLPESSKLDNITSKKMKEQCQLTLHQLQEPNGVDEKGNKKWRYIDIDTMRPVEPEPEPPTP